MFSIDIGMGGGVTSTDKRKFVFLILKRAYISQKIAYRYGFIRINTNYMYMHSHQMNVNIIHVYV